MKPKMIRKHCEISAEGEKLRENAITRRGLSARAHDRILKVARTIADLEAVEKIAPKHLSEAFNTGRWIGPTGPRVHRGAKSGLRLRPGGPVRLRMWTAIDYKV